METRSRSWVAAAGLGIAAIGLAMELLGAWGYRQEWFGLQIALRYLFAYGGIAAALGCLVSLAGLAHARLAGRRGAVVAVIGVVVGLVPALMFYRQYRVARTVPRINDVATDLRDPPAFIAAQNSEFWKGKDLTYPIGFADSVRRGYPDLKSLWLPLPAGQVFSLARNTADRMSGWMVTATDSATGRVEATATTRWFGFTDDVVIRVISWGRDSAIVDMRSKSRVGRSDVGANAARIRAYLAALRRAAR